MNNYREIADRYLNIWNEPDPDRRRALVAAAWAAAGAYADPIMSGQGHAGIAAMIKAARAKFPGHHFTLRGQPDGHGTHLRFSWSLSPTDAAPIAGGTDVAEMDADGRFLVVTGFLDAGSTHV